MIHKIIRRIDGISILTIIRYKMFCLCGATKVLNLDGVLMDSYIHIITLASDQITIDQALINLRHHSVMFGVYYLFELINIWIWNKYLYTSRSYTA